MRTFVAVAALSVALSGLSIAPAYAQAAEREAVIAACAGPGADAGACEAALAAFIAVARTLPPSQRDALLAEVVIVLADSASPMTEDLIADAIEVVAAEFTDPDRAEAALEIAAAVDAGEDLDAGTTAALASPT